MRFSALSLLIAAWSAVTSGAILSTAAYDEYDKTGEIHMTGELAEKIIREEVLSYQDPALAFGRPLCRQYSCCNVTTANSCSISRMPKDETTLVLPGGNTRCIHSYSTPFAFQVVPGDSDKLIFYLQGGGACWNEGSTKAGFCSSDSSPQSLVGIFDRTNEANAFKSYTIVHVLYCSGDVHGGNTTRPYNDKDGQPIVQVGLNNAQSAIDWIKKQISVGNLASEFSSVIVMGASAGSIGAQLWSSQVLKTFKWKTAAIMPDSYAGVFPTGSMGPLIYEYGFCNAGFLSAGLTAKCQAQTLTLQDMMVEFITDNPKVPFSFIQSKTDIVQQAFYIAIGLSMNSTDKWIYPAKFYDDVNEVFGLYNQFPNFLTYLVDGYHHCYSNQAVYYTTDPISKNDDGKSSTSEFLYSWANKFPLASGVTQGTVCDGTLTQKNKKISAADNSYCSTDVNPKTFTEQW